MGPLLFPIMINDVFSETESGIGFCLFADNGVIWKRGRNSKILVKKGGSYKSGGMVEWGMV